MDDLISRSDAIRVASGYCHWSNIPDELEKLPSVNPIPCEDAISRQAVLEGLASIAKAKAKSDAQKAIMGRSMLFVEQLPSVSTGKTGRWIPVSEKLPEVGSEVLVCYDFKGKRSVYIANFYGDGEFHGLDDEYLTSEGRKYRKAVAWMPLPLPYTPQESEVDG